MADLRVELRAGLKAKYWVDSLVEKLAVVKVVLTADLSVELRVLELD